MPIYTYFSNIIIYAISGYAISGTLPTSLLKLPSPKPGKESLLTSLQSLVASRIRPDLSTCFRSPRRISVF